MLKNGKQFTYLIMRIFVAKHVSLSADSRLFSGVEGFSPFPKLINMPTHFVHNACESRTYDIISRTYEIISRTYEIVAVFFFLYLCPQWGFVISRLEFDNYFIFKCT